MTLGFVSNVLVDDDDDDASSEDRILVAVDCWVLCWFSWSCEMGDVGDDEDGENEDMFCIKKVSMDRLTYVVDFILFVISLMF